MTLKPKPIALGTVLPGEGTQRDSQLRLFAVLNLGIVELLASGAMSSLEATRLFFNADNCVYVRKKLRDKVADKIMGHGVQLHDLFEVLPSREAQKEFQRELTSIKTLCLQLLEQHELVA
jgi:hypothetical protein